MILTSSDQNNYKKDYLEANRKMRASLFVDSSSKRKITKEVKKMASANKSKDERYSQVVGYKKPKK